MKRSLAVLAVVCCMGSLTAQLHLPVLKGLTGTALELEIVDKFKPTSTMSYGAARDTLYSVIDVNENGKLECIYTGFSIELDPNVDPTTDAFNKGINAEHSYPQSKGASEGPGRSDLNHLYPAKIEVNSDRDHYPYMESDDENTTFWYYNSEKLSNIPSINKNEYSELQLGSDPLFEPREAIKGNIARGIFYFYTMYKPEALAADPLYFESMRPTLCEWHYNDPVDSREWKRGWDISRFQSGRVNPFILDCSVAARLYCPEVSTACQMLTDIREVVVFNQNVVSDAMPNPVFGEETFFTFQQKVSGNVNVVLSNIWGERLMEESMFVQAHTSHSFQLNLDLRRGVYFVSFQFQNGETIGRKVLKI